LVWPFSWLTLNFVHFSNLQIWIKYQFIYSVMDYKSIANFSD
jgi:hypothetical protein